MNKKRLDMQIAILGAGVAGVSCAIALKQKGFKVRVYERQKAATSIGAGIVIWPNAAFILDQLDVLNEIRKVSGRPSRMRRISKANEELGAINIEKINKLMGYPSLSILRTDFQNVLMKELSSLGVEVCYGHTVMAIEAEKDDYTTICFNNGSKINADVVIGADGRMASLARDYVNGDNTPIYQRFINWIGVYESSVDAFDQIEVMDYWGVGERFGIVPVNKRKAYWAGGIASATIESRDPTKYKDELTSIFSSWPKPVRDMVEGTSAERINKIYVHDHNPVASWHKHNVIMIGDAAHAPLPTSGQGACQALEDAWHLSNFLDAFPNDLQRVFSEFTKKRLHKTTGITMAGRNLASSVFNTDESFCRKRDENSKRTDFDKLAEAMAGAWSQDLPLFD